MSRSSQLRSICYRVIESGCWVVGLALLTFFGSNIALGQWQRQQDIESFLAQLQTPISSTSSLLDPNKSLWSESRKTAFDSMRENSAPAILGILSIPDVRLQVPIYDGENDLNLNRGVARIEGTQLPNQGGNSGIAGHRDGYFRVLKDVEVGQLIKIRGLQGEQTFRISELLIVNPEQVEVLDNTEVGSITLVTCYPFYYVGNAPQRYIVKAVRQY